MIRVPDVGSSDPVDVIEISVKVGDTIAAEDTIIVLESDKATVEVPAPQAGKITAISVKVGDRVKEGDDLMEVEADGESENASSAESDATRDESSTTENKTEPESTPPETDAPDTPKAQGSGGSETVTVPDLGDIDSAEIIEVNVAVGDSLEAEQVIVVLESDKASLEIPAPSAGKVESVAVKVGDKVGTGDTLLTMAVSGGQPTADQQGEADGKPEEPAAAPASQQAQTAQTQKPAPAASSSPAADSGAPSKSVHAGPAVRKLAREMCVDLAQVHGSGPKERILKEDVHAWVKQRLEGAPAASGGGPAVALPEIDFSQFGEVERQELNKLRKVSVQNLTRSWLTIPHVTQHDNADITDLEAFRKQQNKALEKEGVKLTMLAFLVSACARALKEFPRFNSSLENSGEALIQKHYINIGIAVDTPNGLVVPVIKDADRKGLKAIALEMGELAEKARNRKLTPADMKGGTFSISSLGGIGGTAFTPIVNWPEVAILGVSRSDMQPVWDGEQFQPRLMLPLSLSYDHRVIDGADAARFTTYLSQLLTDMRRALL
ncbi:dihydrolipoamide acetyltransferase [Alcanivorax sp. HI0013]|jgi:pyruvate dehydrogenase E2 component (dihydrolipoamide acetyltransferase)|nr:dihydrolipoamide acetyltransferase [Alcanivorax sp. HI0007]KZX70224.1 dihydrolipoamide acetyltransferase [Alcanivorax sp. HI0003]KZX78393.1 dihydrolipoamide acetyltransferase [Alcanivorax sp. HI0011]KZX83584.1 dihydrolipoamide acetyltransferase [Alcanivorax sp. HI0013]KZY12369.1 dihydrolipoamide acetyltransferase [Alcanivorax sp. HI0035]